MTNGNPLQDTHQIRQFQRRLFSAATAIIRAQQLLLDGQVELSLQSAQAAARTLGDAIERFWVKEAVSHMTKGGTGQ